MSHSSETVQFALNSEQRAIRDLAVSFAEERIAPFAIEWDQEKHFPRDVVQSAAPLGLGGICVAEDVGGSAMSRLEAVLIYDGLAAGCPCIAGYFSVHNMVASIIDKYGSTRAANAMAAAIVLHWKRWALIAFQSRQADRMPLP